MADSHADPSPAAGATNEAAETTQATQAIETTQAAETIEPT
ncbi:hypothetical protein ACFXKS_21555 [Streptomyces scopuliridis]